MGEIRFYADEQVRILLAREVADAIKTYGFSILQRAIDYLALAVASIDRK